MKVSIIIPIYNRAHLIGETLESIIAQTHTNWECIVVDDWSDDATVSVVDNYVNKDKRIQVYKRLLGTPKGANACRNMGLNKAQGDYVVFFDSDDLMTPNHLAVKVAAIVEHEVDYVITRTKFFNADLNYIDNYYQFDKYEITNYNYVSQYINWLTYDVCIKRDLAQSIQFNEQLQSGQEYNYFSKLTLKSTDAIYMDTVVTLRRYHEDSIRSQLKSDIQLKTSYFKSNWFTYQDIKKEASMATQNVLMSRCVDLCYQLKKVPISNKISVYKAMCSHFKFRAIYFVIMMIAVTLFNKGYVFRNKLVIK